MIDKTITFTLQQFKNLESTDNIKKLVELGFRVVIHPDVEEEDD